MMCGDSCGDGSILAVGEIRPREDTSLLLPSRLSDKTKTAKRWQKAERFSSTAHPLKRVSSWKT